VPRPQKINAALFIMLSALSGPSWASNATPTRPRPGPTPCAVLEDFMGRVEILDESRSRMIQPALHAGVSCGSWISIEDGWAKLKHRDGHRFHIGPQSFVQLPENNADGKFAGDHLVLFRGQIYADSGIGANELRVITANARSRIQQGAAVVLFNEKEEESQVIALENSASLENRFSPAKKMIVKAGESSTLNFKLLRVVPSGARAVSVSHLRPVLSDLRVSGRDQEYAIRNAHRRLNRKFASVFGEDSADDRKQVSARSTRSTTKSTTTYLRHRSTKMDSRLKKHWVSRMTAGEPAGEEILFNNKGKRRGPAGRIEIQRYSQAQRGTAKNNNDEMERQRLIQELTPAQVRAGQTGEASDTN